MAGARRSLPYQQRIRVFSSGRMDLVRDLVLTTGITKQFDPDSTNDEKLEGGIRVH